MMDDDYVGLGEEPGVSHHKQTFREVCQKTRHSGIRDVLTLWGNWARCRTGTEYPSIAVGMQGCLEPPELPECCNDEEGMVIDRAVASLKKYDQSAFVVIMARYVKSLSQASVATGAKKSIAWVKQEQQIGESYLAGVLLDHDEIFEA